MMKEGKTFYVYIMASKRNGTLYIGVTGSLIHRIEEHKSSEIKGFTQKYKINILVYYEEYEFVSDAINRETQIKKWNRDWKLRLIEEANPDWIDIYEKIMEGSFTGFPPPRE